MAKLILGHWRESGDVPGQILRYEHRKLSPFNRTSYLPRARGPSNYSETSPDDPMAFRSTCATRVPFFGSVARFPRQT